MADLSKSLLANPLYQISKEQAVQLEGLCTKVQGYWWTGVLWMKRREYFIYCVIVKKMNHDKRRWLIQFDNGDDDALMRYYTILY